MRNAIIGVGVAAAFNVLMIGLGLVILNEVLDTVLEAQRITIFGVLSVIGGIIFAIAIISLPVHALMYALRTRR